MQTSGSPASGCARFALSLVAVAAAASPRHVHAIDDRERAHQLQVVSSTGVKLELPIYHTPLLAA